MSIPQNLDREKILEALMAGLPGPSQAEAARLVEGWIEGLETFPEINWKVLFVETPFYIQLERKTFVVGQMDAGFEDEEGIVLGEWKSRRAPKLRKSDGKPYEGDDEDGWLEEISNGLQLGVYALAGREGQFVVPNYLVPQVTDHKKLGLREPRILVRAAIKSNPVVTWPKDYKKGLFTFPGPLLDTVKAALVSEAASIRARRKLAQVPYQIPGIHCTNMYHRTCEYLESVCRPRFTPSVTPVGWSHPEDLAPDPGLEVCKILNLDILDPEIVVLSASALVTNYQCAERARIQYGGYFRAAGDQFDLNVGSGLHRGLAAIYRQFPRK